MSEWTDRRAGEWLGESNEESTDPSQLASITYRGSNFIELDRRLATWIDGVYECLELGIQ